MTGDVPTDDAAGADATRAGPSDRSSVGSWTPDALVAIREDPRRRRLALVVAALLGIGVAWIHWLGLFVAGALVGLASRSLPRAVIAGLAVGCLALAVHVVSSPVMGAGEFLALAPASYVTVAAALLVPAWGSLIRGVL